MCLIGDLAPNFDGFPAVDSLVRSRADTVILKFAILHGQLSHTLLFNKAGKWQIWLRSAKVKHWTAGVETERMIRTFLTDSVSLKHVTVLNTVTRYGVADVNYLLVVNNRIIQSLNCNVDLNEIPDEEIRSKVGFFSIFKMLGQRTVERE